MLTLYCKMIIEYRSCHGMESTSVLQIMDQVGLWRIEKKNFMYYMQIISMSTYILLSWKCKTCQRTPPRRSLSLGKSSFLERHSFWSWRRGPEASIFKISEGLLAEPTAGVCRLCGSIYSDELSYFKSLSPCW